MFGSIMPIGRFQALIAIFFVFATERFSITSTLTAATLIKPKQNFWGTQIAPSQRHPRQNDEMGQETQIGGQILGDITPSWHHSIIPRIARGGGNTAERGSRPKEEESLSSVARTEIGLGSIEKNDESFGDDVVCNKSTIITIGVVDLSRIESNRPGLYSSIVLVVENDTRKYGIPVDEILSQRNLFPLFHDKEGGASIEIFPEEMENDANTILESLAVLCDVLLVRIGEEETLAPEFMSYVARGNRQRESAGMAGGKHWISTTKGSDEVLQRLTDISSNGKNDDNRCYSSTTTWSTLFSSSRGEIENDNLKEIITSLSQQMIQSKGRSMMKLKGTTRSKSSENQFGDSFPPVSVLYINKDSKHVASKGDDMLEKTAETSSWLNKEPEENNPGQTNPQHENDETVGNVIEMAYRRLGELEEKMQELILDQSSNPMPLLEFGSLVQDILYTTDVQLKEESGMNDSFRRGLMKGIVVEVQRLYEDQLQALRNYYGQRYESILDEEVEKGIENDEIVERRWAAGAEHMTQAFLAAARNSVPAMYQNDVKNAKDVLKTEGEPSFDHVDALQGLLQDMIEATERRKDERNVASILEANEKDTSDSAPTSARKIRLPKLPKWLERLTARAFVFGVNYFQGWLAWQGIKRAALERDRNQPKFPLF